MLKEVQGAWLGKTLRRIPARFPGKLRLAKLIWGDYLKGTDVELVDRDGYIYLVPSLEEPIALHLLVNGRYELEEHRLLLRLLQAGSVFVDVGANVGTFTIPAAGRVGPSGQVLAVEASPKMAHYLRVNLSVNKAENVCAVECALYSEEGTVAFYEAPTTHFGMGSLAAQFQSEQVYVRARRLDSLLQEKTIEDVDVIKVDVEGFEERVFDGAEELLRRKEPPVVVFEFCDWAERRAAESGEAGSAQSLLAEWGFQLWRLSRSGLAEIRPDGVAVGSATLVAAKGARIAVVEAAMRH